MIVGGRVIMTKPERKDSLDDPNYTLSEDIYTKYQERPVDFNSPLANPMMTRTRSRSSTSSCTTSSLAEAWSEFTLQGNLQSISVSSKHVWVVDRNDRVFYSSMDQPKLVWKQGSVPAARQISVSPDGGIVWVLDRSGMVTVATRVTSRAPLGLSKQTVLTDVACISVDNTSAW